MSAGSMNKFHLEFYNEMNQNTVTVNGYTCLYVNWLEQKLVGAQKNEEAPETIDNTAMLQLLNELDQLIVHDTFTDAQKVYKIQRIVNEKIAHLQHS